jgi:IS4 transposase
MATHNQLNTDLSNELFKPVFDVYFDSSKQYKCTGISDINFCQLGTLRCLSSAKTGHEFLQHHADHEVADIDVDHFFKALKSKRRLKNLTSINRLLSSHLSAKTHDPLDQFPELAKWEVNLIDGHYQKAACFDPKHEDSKGELKSVATGHFFRLDLRNQHLSCLDFVEPGKGKKKSHDVRVIRKSLPEVLRNNAPKGVKMMLVWDKACIDYRLWFDLKNTYGVYFITMEKGNSAATVSSGNLVDRSDSRNEGVVSDHLVDTSTGVQLRRIVYTNPRDGKTYTYLTNDFTLPAGVLVLLYKHRWDEEKVFYELKSKMEERKSWASSNEAKQAHAVFLCLAHNLLLLLEEHVIQDEGLIDEYERKKDLGRKRTGSPESLRQNKVGNMINTAIARATHRTQRFIRWVRNRIYMQVPWSQSLNRLSILWQASN